MEPNTPNPPANPAGMPPQIPPPPNTRHIKKILFPVIIFIVFLLIIAGINILNKLQQTDVVKTPTGKTTISISVTLPPEPNPKFELLTTLPPVDPNLYYNIPLEPQKSLIYSIEKYAYSASRSSTIVNNGKSGKTYQEIDSLTPSPDGKHIAYIAKADDKEFVVLDGVEGKKYDDIKNLTFSPDSRHIAYAAGEDKYYQPDNPDKPISGSYKTKTMFVVLDTAEGKKYDGVFVGSNFYTNYNPVFSRDSKKITYSALSNGKNIIAADNNELADYESQQYPQFIGNTYDLIYTASENGKEFLVVAGRRQPSHDGIFATDKFPYFIGNDSSQIVYEAVDNNVRSVILNMVSYPVTSGVLDDLAFSTSGTYTAYYTGTINNKDLYVNGQKVTTVQSDAELNVSSPLFSPDEQLLVYSDYDRGKENAALHIYSPSSLQKIADLPLPGFSAIGPLKFSEDSKSLYFKGIKGRDIFFITVDLPRLTHSGINQR